jgi:hypothetical protein
MGSRAIGGEVGCTPGTASKWRVRYACDRIAGLSETGERGAERTYGPEQDRRILAMHRGNHHATRFVPGSVAELRCGRSNSLLPTSTTRTQAPPRSPGRWSARPFLYVRLSMRELDPDLLERLLRRSHATKAECPGLSPLLGGPARTVKSNAGPAHAVVADFVAC